MKKASLKDLLSINWAEVADAIGSFLIDYLRKSGGRGYVIGVSGGIDSSTAIYLATKYVGSKQVHALIMPDSRTTPKDDIEDALKIVEKTSVSYNIIYIDKIFDEYINTLPFSSTNKIPNGNLRARIRMNILYYYANVNNYLVLGTGDRSELLIGYYTKYGDGAVDILPLGSLYKTQVRALAKFLGVPQNIVTKPSSPRLWPGHLAEEELGMKYEEIDLILYSLFDLGLSPNDTAKYTGVSLDKVYKVIKMHINSRHKRRLPPIPSIPGVNEPIKELEINSIIV